MEIVIEFVVKNILKSADFYTKYLEFEIEYTEYEPISWMQLKKDNKEIYLDLRKADYRYELGVYDEDKNMILITKPTDN